MNNIIKNLTLAIDKMTMLSLKFVSNSLRSATAMATNHIGSTVALPSNSSLHSAINNKNNNETYRNPLAQTGLSQSRLFTTSPQLELGAMSESRARKVNINTMETDLSLPIKPKKPATPWIRFVQERKNDVLSQKEKMTAAELAIILAKEWKQIDRSKYERDYSMRRDEYLKNIEAYEKSLTEEHRDFLSQKKGLAKASKTLRKLRKTHPPVLPRNPANFYCAEKCSDENIKEQLKSGKSGTVLSDLFKEYRLLNDREKEKYLQLQKKDKERFQQEFNSWYEGVMKDDSGHSKSVKKLAESMRTKFESLGYI